LVHEIGVYSIAGIGVIILLLILIILIGKLISKATQSKLKLSSKRNEDVTFVLNGIKSIKFNCWEEVVYKKIIDQKQKENRDIFTLNAFENISNGLNNVIPTISGFITIVLYNSIEEEKLSLSQVFFILSAFGTLTSPLKFFYFAISGLQQVLVSMGRIQKLFQLPEHVSDIQNSSLPLGSIRFNECCPSYKEKDFEKKILLNLDDKKLIAEHNNLTEEKSNKFYHNIY
jgi:ABC-type bacteriocin/lantibiotic exporter with double-glycine peptidase domain